MLGVLHGFAVILGLIGAGYLASRTGVVRGEQRQVLNRVAFYIANPAMLFTVLQSSDPSVLLSPVTLVTTFAALIAAAVFVTASRLFFPRGLATTALGATTSSYVNANNLGLPVALYILGDVAFIAPLMVVQLVVFTPIILTTLEAAKGSGGGAFVTLGRAISNPNILASLLGFIVALLNLSLPNILLEPLSMLGAAAIPMLLMGFGASLQGQRALMPGNDRAAVLTASTLKIVAMPLFAWMVCLALGMSQHETLVAVTISALPVAQNVYNFAATYGQAKIMVRDTVFLTTFASLPAIALLAWLLGA